MTSEEIRLFLIDFGLAVSKEDLSLFMKRLDRRQNGTVSLEDFKREFTPRLQLKKKLWETFIYRIKYKKKKFSLIFFGS